MLEQGLLFRMNWIKKILLLTWLIPCLSLAQTPIVLVVPFSPGGPADQVAKVIQKTLSQEINRDIRSQTRGGR